MHNLPDFNYIFNKDKKTINQQKHDATFIKAHEDLNKLMQESINNYTNNLIKDNFMTIVVNMFSGPGGRKSTMASSVFSELKWLGVNCEYAPEYAKDKVWEESFHILDDQIMVFGKQYHRIWRLIGKTDVILVDSPLLFSIIYDKSKSPELKNLVLKEFEKCNNMNYYIVRKAKFNQSGRIQNEEQSKEKDVEIKTLLDSEKIPYKIVDGVRESVQIIVDDVMQRLKG